MLIAGLPIDCRLPIADCALTRLPDCRLPIVQLPDYPIADYRMSKE
jgi:hypothetical protein